MSTHEDVRTMARHFHDHGGLRRASLYEPRADSTPPIQGVVDRLVSAGLLRLSGEWVVFTLEGLRVATEAGVKHGQRP